MESYQVRAKVSDYLDNKISLSELEEWIVPHLPQLARYPDTDDALVVSAVELALAEFSDGIITEAEVRERLQDELRSSPTPRVEREPVNTLPGEGRVHVPD